jgi:hypothetical protein
MVAASVTMGAQQARAVLLTPLALLATAVRALVARPAVLVAATVLLVCLPVGDRDLSASVHVTPADLASAALALAVIPPALAGHRGRRTSLPLALGATAAALGWATLASQDPAGSLSGLVRYLQLFVVVPVTVALAVKDRRDLRLVCAALLTAAVVEGIVGTRQYLTATGASFAGRSVRAVGTFGALDVMGMSTVVGYGLVVAFGLALALRGRARLGLFVLAALLVVPMLLSLSRGAILATAGALALMLAVAGPRLALRSALFGAAAGLVLLGGLGAPAGAVAGRFATIASSVTQPDRSVSDRYELWQTAVGMWRDHPVTGVGLKQFAEHRDAYAPLHLSSGSDVADAAVGFRREPLLSPHSMYLLVLSEQGLLGALAFGALLSGLAVRAWRRTRQVAQDLGPPDGRRPDGRLVSVAAVGIIAWTLLNFLYADIGGPSTVLMSVLLGLVLWWAGHPAAVRTCTAAAR